MSDDTPTQKFDSTGDVPTERFEQAPEPHAEGADAAEDSARKSRRLLIVLASIGGALLVAVLILIVVLTSAGGEVAPEASETATESASPSPTPSDSPAPSESPSPSETSTATAPPTEPTGARFTNFIAASSVACSMGGPGVDPFVPIVEVAWTTAGADEAWYVNGTSDAADSGYMQIPLSGDENDFPFPQSTNCNNDENKYTITLVAPNGDHVSKTWTVVNTGDNF